MRVFNRIILLCVLCVALSSCGDRNPARPRAKEQKWWILVHPNSSAGEPGIFLYNERTDKIERKLDLPVALKSPHALEYDGEYLWLGGADADASIYELDPETGAELAKLSGIRTEGIAAYEGGLCYSTHPLSPIDLKMITTDGTLLGTVHTSALVINDVAVQGTNLYFAVNDDTDKIIQIDPESGEENIVANTNMGQFYALAIRDDVFVTIYKDKSTDRNAIRRIDMKTGEMLSDTEICIEGWITAISPHVQR